MCCLIFVVPPLVHAGVVGSTSRYVINAVKSIKGGASVEATSTATGARHMIRHGVSAEALGKGIGAGIIQFGVAAGLGLAFEAITGLALSAVDWIQDPENNGIKWRPKPFDKPPYIVGKGSELEAVGRTREDACKQYAKNYNTKNADSSSYYYYGTVGISGTPTVSSPFYCYVGRDRYGVKNDSYARADGIYQLDKEEIEWKKLPYVEIARKTLEMADNGNTISQDDVVEFVKKQAESGALDKELDDSVDVVKPDDETSQCSAGYVKNGQGVCIKKETEQNTCPVGTVKVGEKCIKLPDDDETSQCGDCCVELIEILSEMSKMNKDFYEQSLDNDALMLYQFKQLNSEVSDISNNVNSLLDEAKLTNKTLKEINDNQEIHFNDLKTKLDDFKKAMQDDNKEIKQKLDDTLNEAKKTNEKLDLLKEKLDKINENLEKMQKCNETEFNKKMCDMADWFQDKFEKPDENGNIDVKDFELPTITTDKVKFDNQCPAPTPLDISIPSLMINFHDELNYQPLCDFMTKLRPFVVGFGYVSGAFIVAGVGRKNG